MRHLFVISESYAPGSAVTNHTLSLIRGLCENGHNVVWVFLLPDAQMSRLKVPFDGLVLKYLWNSRFSRGKVLKHLFKQLAYGWFYLFTIKKGDTVLLCGLSAYIKCLLLRKGVKVFHERTEHPEVVTNTRYHLSLKKYLGLCKQLDGLFVITSALKNYYIANGVSRDKVHVINMVVDANRFIGIEKRKDIVPYIAYCGNASNTKDGVDDLIKAFQIIVEYVKDINLKVIGPAPEPNSINLLLVKQLELTNRIEFTGRVSPEQMPQLLKDASVLVLSRPNSLQNKYGFPTKLGEYLLTGNPVCVTRVGDIPLFLQHKKTALLSECRDIRSFADNVVWCLIHSEQAKEIGEAGKVVAEDNFNYLIESEKMADVMSLEKF